MKLSLLLLWLAALSMGLGALRSQTRPVSAALVAPLAGATVSNTITLTATASSTMGPITRVEFYDVFCATNAGIVTCVTNLISVVTNRPAAPQNFRVD